MKGKMLPWLRADTAFAEDASSVPSTDVGWLTVTCNSISWEANASGFGGHPHLCAHTHTQIHRNTHNSK